MCFTYQKDFSLIISAFPVHSTSLFSQILNTVMCAAVANQNFGFNLIISVPPKYEAWFGWLDLLSAESSLKWYCQRPRSQQMGEGDRLYLMLLCHQQNDSCSDESHFNVSLIRSNKDTWKCPQSTTSEERASQSRIELRSFLISSLMFYG